MKYKGPKITSFNQTRRRLEKTVLERLLNPKNPLESQKNKCHLNTKKCSTKYKVSKAMITDLGTKTWTHQPSRRTNFKLRDERKFKPRNLKGLKTSTRCDIRLLDSQSHARIRRSPSKQKSNRTRTRKPY